MENTKKHAYLLMLHHRKDLVDLLLKELDDVRNDLYIHIDPTFGELNINDFNLKHSKIYEVEPMRVIWGDFSQIECELRLMEKAKENGPYAYYHLVQGSSFPLKNQDQLHKFYDDNQGKEFINIGDHERYKFRIDYYHVLTDSRIYKYLLKLQQILGVSRLKKYNLKFAKGQALWSITDDFLNYVLSKKALINELFKYSLCGDEIFIQTLAYNSDFKEHIYGYDKKRTSSMWVLTWELEEIFKKIRENHNFKYEDFDYLMKKDANFARKFEDEDGVKLINKIKKHINKN